MEFSRWVFTNGFTMLIFKRDYWDSLMWSMCRGWFCKERWQIPERVFVHSSTWGKGLCWSRAAATQEVSKRHGSAQHEGWPAPETKGRGREASRPSFYWSQLLGLCSTLSKLEFVETHSKTLKTQDFLNNNNIMIIFDYILTMTHTIYESVHKLHSHSLGRPLALHWGPVWVKLVFAVTWLSHT